MRSSSQTLSDSYKVLMSHLPLFATLLAVPTFLAIGLEIFYFEDFFKDEYSTGYNTGLLILSVINFFFSLAVIHVAAFRSSSTKETALKFAARYALPVFVTSIIAALAVLFGLVLLIIPGIIFAFWFSLSMYAVMFDEKEYIDALKTSKKYVKGNIWKLCKRNILILLVCIPIILIAIAQVFYVKTPADYTLFVAFTLLFELAYAFTTALATIYGYEIYRDLRGAYEAATQETITQ